MQTEAKVWEIRNNGEGGKRNMKLEKGEFFDDVSLELNVEEFNKLKQKALDLSNSDEDIEEKDSSMFFRSLKFDVLDESIKDGRLEISGSLIDKESGLVLGWVGFDVDLTLDTVAEITSAHMKKLGKLKTVLEATKE